MRVAIASGRGGTGKTILTTNLVCVAAGRVPNGEKINQMVFAAKGN